MQKEQWDDISSEVRGALPELALIDDEGLREGVVAVWARMVRAWGGELAVANFMAPDVDPAVGWLHVRSVIRLAVDAAVTMRDVYGMPINVDVVAAGAALHDVCKPMEYAEERPGSFCGRRLHHSVLGTAFIVEEGLPIEVAHIVAYHSPSAEAPGGRSLEARLVRALDGVSFDGLMHGHPGRGVDG